jgi:hypothetical protein
MQGHAHISKVIEWGFDADHNFKATKYGCVLCEETQDKPFEYEEIEIDHTACDDDCFGCKAKGLQLATGDAAGNIIASGTTQKKWDKELQLYRDAKAQGVQPAGTSTKAIRSALEASEVLNKPYNADKMPATQHITKETVAVMKEIGQI